MEPKLKRKYGLIAVMILSVVGVIFSADLLRVHLTVASDPDHSFACQISEQVSCNKVALSRQAIFLGVPVPVWGILTYLFFGALAILGFKAKRQRPLDSAGDYIMPLAIWSVLYSAYLAYVSAFVIKTLCVFCAALYAVNLGLLAAGFLSASPLGHYFSRRRDDLQWLRSRPTVMGFAAGALFMALVLVFYLHHRSSRVVFNPSPEIKIDISRDPMVGAFRAPITIIEFSDYECPACRRMHGTIKEVLKEYQGKVRIVYKNFPLNPDCNPKVRFRMHEYACGAAAAAECAHEMGKFAAVSERLWTAEDLSLPGLLRIASDEGLDVSAFQECLNSPGIRDKIMADVDAGLQLELNATPSFIINGYKFSGYRPVEETRKIFDGLLKNGVLPPDAFTPPPK